jgi:hypothetical protein
MFNHLPWQPSAAVRSVRTPLLALAMAATGATGAWLLFLHLMQRSATFAEAVAKISPNLANTYSCSCPFCSGLACLPPADQQGLERFHNNFPKF